jgi:hypothetical protein
LAFALVTNTVKWDSEFVERDKDDKWPIPAHHTKTLTMTA